MKTDSCQFNQTITAPRKYRWLLNVSLFELYHYRLKWMSSIIRVAFNEERWCINI